MKGWGVGGKERLVNGISNERMGVFGIIIYGKGVLRWRLVEGFLAV